MMQCSKATKEHENNHIDWSNFFKHHMSHGAAVYTMVVSVCPIRKCIWPTDTVKFAVCFILTYNDRGNTVACPCWPIVWHYPVKLHTYYELWYKTSQRFCGHWIMCSASGSGHLKFVCFSFLKFPSRKDCDDLLMAGWCSWTFLPPPYSTD